MPTDQLVPARLILRAQLEHRRLRPAAALRRLEALEPDLAEYVMETLSQIQRGLFDAGANPRETRRIARDAEALVLVSIEAMRRGCAELWEPGVPPSAASSRDDPG